MKADADGHCEGDDCQNIQVSVAVTKQPTISTSTSFTTDRADVGGELTYTLTYKEKPLIDTDVHEDVVNRTTVNGKNDPMDTRTGDGKTDEAGNVVDSSGIVKVTSKGYVRIGGNEAEESLTQNVREKNTTQTWTFKAPKDDTNMQQNLKPGL